MSEAAPPLFPEATAGSHTHALTPENIDRAINDFRAWLQEAARDTARGGASAAEAPLAQPDWDVTQLAAHFTALRHEVHLQTRAARAQQEQSAAALALVQETLAALRDRDQQASSAAEEKAPAWLKVLLEVQDALDAAHREVARLAGNLQNKDAAAKRYAAPPGFWARWFGKGAPQGDDGKRLDDLLAALLTGYSMSRDRLQRVLAEQGLETIPCEGRPFDPESMEVFEVAAQSGVASGTVLNELRRGYRWRGRLYRSALVRVAQ